MFHGHGLDGLSESELRSAADRHRKPLQAVADELVPGSIVSLDVGTVGVGFAKALLVAVTVRHIDLRLGILERHLDADLGGMLAQRIREAARWEDRLVDRFADVKSKLEASLARNGGMPLLNLRLEPSPIDHPLHWRDSRLEAEIELLDADLKPRSKLLRDHSARSMAGSLAPLREQYVRRRAKRDRLAQQGAVLEIELDAEEFIVRQGGRVGEVAAALLRAKAIDQVARLEACPGIELYEGTIAMASATLRNVPCRGISAHELPA
jgi:hypothetical protein